MTFQCIRCPDSFSQFQEIIDHFKGTGEIIDGVEMITDKKSIVIK